MKVCYTCKVEKELNKGNFQPRKINKDGFLHNCRKCNKLVHINWKRSINGLISEIYTEQLKSCKMRKHPPPDYDRKWFKEWMLAQVNFKSLYKDWETSDYKTSLRPSVDRLENSISYRKDNIRLVTWKINNKSKRK